MPALSDLLVATALCKSKSEVRRTVAEGGIYLNNTRVTDGEAPVPPDAWLHGRFLVLRRGKRSVAGAVRDVPVGVGGHTAGVGPA